MKKAGQSRRPTARPAASGATADVSGQTAAAAGYRMPAEWEPQKAIWLSWPHRKATWPRHFRPIPGVFARIVATISRFEEVHVNASRELVPAAKRLCARAGAVMERVFFHHHPTNDAWCRDHGPIFVKHRRSGELAVLDWKFNAWGGKYPRFDLDTRVPGRVARLLGLRRFQPGIVLEGGSIDVNGEGLLLTTEACLLNPNRNPHLSREKIEQYLRDFLGVQAVYWLGDGVVGDDTDGHVDDLARFFKADGIVTAVESNRRDANHRALRENLERLESFRTPDGRRFDLRVLPMPKPVFCDGKRLPATYANFLILNDAVLVPVFGQPKRDAEALEILGNCFPGREVIGLDCVDLVLGLGTLHCISQQQPA